MAEWYWMKDGAKHGPVDTAHLKQLARTGRIEPTDSIWRDGLPDWVPAGKAKGLFPAAASQPSQQSAQPVATAPSTTENAKSPSSDRQNTVVGCLGCSTVLVILFVLLTAGSFWYPSETSDTGEATDMELDDLSRAIKAGRTSEVRRLLDAGALPDGAGDERGIPVAQAAIGDEREIIEMLIDRGASLEIGTGKGQYTPLHLAAMIGKHEMVELLIRRGANVHSTHAEGETPLELARSMQRMASDAPLTLRRTRRGLARTIEILERETKR